MCAVEEITINGSTEGRYAEILTPEAIGFVVSLDREFDFLPSTSPIRNDPSWTVAPPPADLLDRRVEITGPPERKMTINALNSGAKVWMADFEDATAPTWDNITRDLELWLALCRLRPHCANHNSKIA